jgi:hypothetical protein
MALQLTIQPEAAIDSNPYFTVQTQELWDFLTNMQNFRLYMHTWSIQGSDTVLTWYNHDPDGGKQTPYARYIAFEPLAWWESDEYVLEMKTVVLIQKWWFTGEVMMEWVIGKILD